jgi:hypothetical protein
MSKYLTKYISDIGKIHPLIILDVYLVRETSLTTEQGIRENTNYDFDKKYIPKIFFNFVKPITKNIKTCGLTSIIKRYAKLYLNPTDYLRVELPFKPSSLEYEQFFLAVMFNLDIYSVGYTGEITYQSLLKTL